MGAPRSALSADPVLDYGVNEVPLSRTSTLTSSEVRTVARRAVRARAGARGTGGAGGAAPDPDRVG